MKSTSTKSLELHEMKEGSQMESIEDTKQNINNGKGGWLSAILILGTSFGLNIASGAWVSNLIVFLISVFNVKHIAAAQISSIFNGFINFCPFIAAILADSAFGPFSIVLFSSMVSLVGVLMFTLLVTIKSLRPPTCAPNAATTCVLPTTFQYSYLYASLTLASIGLGGTRYILASMGADQFDKPKHQANFFNWFTFLLYSSVVIGFTLIIYIQTNVSWALSFVIAFVANLIGVALFLLGSKLYRKFPPQGSPFISIARVFVASMRNKKMEEPVNYKEECYLYESEDSKSTYGEPTKSLRFLNRAALIKQGDNNISGTKRPIKSWSQCTVEEVEDLKKLIILLPLWSSSILISGFIGVIISFTTLMALVMDRRVGTLFEIPAGTFTVIGLVFTSLISSILDRFVYPTYKKLTGKQLTYLQCIGVCHVSNILGAIGFALIERNRLELVKQHHLTDQPNAVAPLSGLWFLFPLIIMGIGEGLCFAPEVAFFYQEFPKSLRSTSTAMISLHIAAGFYLSSGFIDLVARTSSWLPNDINFGRLDNACWVLAIIAAVNYGYFLVCAMFYKYNNPFPNNDDL